MKLVRLATIHLSPPPPEYRSLAFKYEGGELTVVTHGPAQDGYLLLVAAQVSLISSPEVNKQGEIAIPEEPRRWAEGQIEHFANLIAVREGASRKLGSPSLSIAFIPESDRDRQLLSSAIKPATETHSIFGIRPAISLPVADLQASIRDRSDGVALLAEALSHDHATGQFHEFVRLFERAFACSPFELVQPLTGFLSGSKQGFTEAEVRQWLIELRHPATHADRRSEFLLEADVRPVIWRMRQAAYDVLMNKKEWRSPSPERRSTWLAPAWTPAPSGDTIYAREGGDFQAQMQWLDDFGAFPFDLKAEIRDILPDEWWVRLPDPSSENA